MKQRWSQPSYSYIEHNLSNSSQLCVTTMSLFIVVITGPRTSSTANEPRRIPWCEGWICATSGPRVSAIKWTPFANEQIVNWDRKVGCGFVVPVGMDTKALIETDTCIAQVAITKSVKTARNGTTKMLQKWRQKTTKMTLNRVVIAQIGVQSLTSVITLVMTVSRNSLTTDDWAWGQNSRFVTHVRHC
jgi:hypothetical protein